MNQAVARPRTRFFYGYWLLFIAFLIQVALNGSAGYSFSLFVLPVEIEFHWSRASIMLASMLSAMVTGLSSPFIGRLISRFSAKWVIAAGGLLMGLSFFLLSFTQSLWQFYLLFALVGLSYTASGVIPLSMVISRWFKKRRGFAIGILGMGIGVGGFLIPRILSTYIIPNLGWRNGYLFCGILLAAVIIPLAILFVRSTPEEMGFLPDNGDTGEDKGHRASRAPEPGFTLEQARESPALWLMGLSFLTFAYANGHTFQNQVPHLQGIGFASATAAVAVQAVGIGSAFGKFGFGWLCDYIPPKFILVIGSALQIVATLMLMNFNSDSPESLLWVYGLIMGLGVGSWLPALSMVTSATFGLIAYGVIFGICNMLFSIGSAIGPFIGGVIFDSRGSYHLSFIICLLCYAVSVPAMLLVKRPKQEKH